MIGVTNKIVTILVNLVIWDKHATPSGLAALLICILGGIWYQHSVTSLQVPNVQSQQDDPESLESVSDKFQETSCRELELSEKALLLLGEVLEKGPAQAPRAAPTEE